MPLRSPSGICWASANGSPEIVQEFVICESSPPPHCLVWRSSAATGRAASHAGLHCFPFSTRNSGKTQCQRCPLASTPLAHAHLLKVLHPVAQYFRLARKRWFRGRREPAGCVLYLRADYSGLLCSSYQADSSFGDCWEQRLAHHFCDLLFDFHFLV